MTAAKWMKEAKPEGGGGGGEQNPKKKFLKL